MPSKWLQPLAGLLVSAGVALAQSPAAPSRPVPFSVQTVSSTGDLSPAAPGTPPPGLADQGLPGSPWVADHSALPSSGPAGQCVDEITTDGSRTWFRAEYLYWWVREQKTPALAGTVPLGIAMMDQLPPGSITPLFGGTGDRIHYNGQSGARFTGGVWTDPSQTLGFEASFFQLGKNNLNFIRRTIGDPVVGPVFNDPVAAQQVILLPIDPTVQTSTVSINATNQLWGAELNALRRGTAIFFADRLDLLCGFRYAQFDETLDEFAAVKAPPGSNLASIGTFDNFSVHNRFYGPQIGFVSRWTYGNWFVDTTGKLALGILDREAHVNGGTGLVIPGTTSVGLPGGILAQPSNSGSFENARFSVLSELTFNGGYQIASGAKVFVGYNFLCINNVVRAGGLIDQVDSRQVPGLNFPNPPPPDALRPRTDFRDARFWAHGFNAGIELKY
jgi:Putative beta barrel porin-7 (BBP7)